MKALKAYFLSRTYWEKVLVTVFVAVGALVWLFSYTKAGKTFWTAQAKSRTTLAAQKKVIDRRQDVDKRAELAVSKLDPTKTLNGNRLSATVSNLSASSGVPNPNVASGKQSSTAQFAINTVTATFQRAEWMPLVNLYKELEKLSPYLSIDQMTINYAPAAGGRGGPGGGGPGGRGGPAAALAAVPTHTVTMTLSSVEIIKAN